MPARYVGKPVAIHAAKRKPTREERDWIDGFAEIDWENLPLGGIVAVGWFDPSKTTNGPESANLSEDEQLWGDYSVGRWFWPSTKIIKLPEFIPLKGQQGFWTLDDLTTSEIKRQLRDNLASGGGVG